MMLGVCYNRAYLLKDSFTLNYRYIRVYLRKDSFVVYCRSNHVQVSKVITILRTTGLVRNYFCRFPQEILFVSEFQRAMKLVFIYALNNFLLRLMSMYTGPQAKTDDEVDRPSMLRLMTKFRGIDLGLCQKCRQQTLYSSFLFSSLLQFSVLQCSHVDGSILDSTHPVNAEVHFRRNKSKKIKPGSYVEHVDNLICNLGK